MEAFLQEEILQSFPVYVGISTGDRCNLNCIFCVQRDSYQSKKYFDISIHDFIELIEPLCFANCIQIQGWGEPLLNPDFEKIFDFVAAYHKGARIGFNTNGTLLNKKWANKLTSTDNVHINISLNASSRETYKHIMNADCFDLVKKNINYLIKLREMRKSKNPEISISMVGMSQNISELPELVNLSANLGVECVILRDLMMLRPELETDSLCHHFEKSTQALKKALDISNNRKIKLETSEFPLDYFIRDRTNFDWKQPSEKSIQCNNSPCREDLSLNPNNSEIYCFEPWTSFRVDSSGNVRVCCYSKINMGNLFEQSFSEIWNGDLYRYYRKYVNTQTPPTDCSNCIRKAQVNSFAKPRS